MVVVWLSENGQMFKSKGLWGLLLPGTGEGEQRHNLRNDTRAILGIVVSFLEEMGKGEQVSSAQSSAVGEGVERAREAPADVWMRGLGSCTPPPFPRGVRENRLPKRKGLFRDFLLLRIINVLLQINVTAVTLRCHGSMSGWSAALD